jgi:hypothetical protein
MSYVAWLCTNVVGLLIYLSLFRPISGDPAQSGPGDGLYFMTVLAPLLLGFIVFNGWRLYKEALPLHHLKTLGALFCWLSLGTLWLMVMRNTEAIYQWLSLQGALA